MPCGNPGVDLKRVPPKSRPAASFGWIAPSEDTARRDPAVHVSLSSDSPVKQPGTKAVPSPDRPESRRSPNRRQRSEAGHRISVELRRRVIAPRRRRTVRRYIGGPLRRCQHLSEGKTGPRTMPDARSIWACSWSDSRGFTDQSGRDTPPRRTPAIFLGRS